jgi:uncharacterized protein (TIGR02246 family)
MKLTLTTFFAVLLFGVAAFGQSAPQISKAEREIRAALNGTADGWNAGDLSKYLAVYTKDATEMLSTGPKGGVEAIEDTMKRGFWKWGRPEQTLRYENILVRMLGKDGAVVTGQYVLTGAGKPDRSGWFTTAWIRTKDGWRMMHDHS